MEHRQRDEHGHQVGNQQLPRRRWDFYQNQDLNAIPYFSTSNQTLSRQEGGASAGGPLYIPGLYRQKEKTFIFGLFEHLSISTPTVDTYTVPDSNFRSGNFSEILGTTP